MKTSRFDIRVIVVFLVIILVLSGKLWMDYKERTSRARAKGGEFTFHSKILGEDRTFIVQLPAGYNDSSEPYPVLYVLDAEMESVFKNAVSMVESQYVLDELPKMIVVGIHNVNRNRDTIPVSVEERPGSGGALNFLQFLDEELIPQIEKSYRTSRPRVLYGASNAGLFAVYALLERPDSFDAYLASSPMIGHCPEYIYGLAEERLAENFQDKFLFMIYGSLDYVKVTEYIPDFVDLMQEKAPEGLRWEVKILDGLGHVPSSSLEEGLIAFLSK